MLICGITVTSCCIIYTIISTYARFVNTVYHYHSFVSNTIQVNEHSDRVLYVFSDFFQNEKPTNILYLCDTNNTTTPWQKTTLVTNNLFNNNNKCIYICNVGPLGYFKYYQVRCVDDYEDTARQAYGRGLWFVPTQCARTKFVSVGVRQPQYYNIIIHIYTMYSRSVHPLTTLWYVYDNVYNR